jgi:transposase
VRQPSARLTRTITNAYFTFARNEAAIAAEARLDGISVLRTPVPQAELDAAATVCCYKALSTVERAFRSCKTIDIEVRPVSHWNEHRVRAHVFLCLLAYHLEWNLAGQRRIDRLDGHRLLANVERLVERQRGTARSAIVSRARDSRRRCQ